MTTETDDRILPAEPTDRMAKARAARAAKRQAEAETPATPAATQEASIDILAELRSMREGFENTIATLRGENAELKRQMEDVASKSSNLDENGVPVNALPPNYVDLRENRPGTLEEMLQAAERQAKQNGDKDFDRERYKRGLLGLPVEDLNPYICSCGKGFQVEAERDVCSERHTKELLKAASRRAR